MLRSCVVLNLAISILVDRLIANFAQEGTLARARTVIIAAHFARGVGVPQTLEGPFSSVSMPIAMKDVFFTIFPDL